MGEAIKEAGLPRSSLYITTKYSGIGTSQQAIQQSLNKVSSPRITRELLAWKAQYGLVEIGISYLDLYLVHFPGSLPNFESGWQEFEKMKKDGLTRCVLRYSNMVR